jgi:dTDP-4-dehydrorhamnose 3,5-epimerase
MKVTPLKIPDVLLIEPEVFVEERGFFFESFNLNDFKKATGLDVNFVQDNHSKSIKGVLRGLHYQLAPYSQGKLVRVIQGEVFDVAVDLRKSSPTFGEYVSEILSAENKKEMWIPEGFAHAFLTLSESAEFLYKVTNYYHPQYERSIIYNDKTLNINWSFDQKLYLSSKDNLGSTFLNAEVFS